MDAKTAAVMASPSKKTTSTRVLSVRGMNVLPGDAVKQTKAAVEKEPMSAREAAVISIGRNCKRSKSDSMLQRKKSPTKVEKNLLAFCIFEESVLVSSENIVVPSESLDRSFTSEAPSTSKADTPKKSPAKSPLRSRENIVARSSSDADVETLEYWKTKAEDRRKYLEQALIENEMLYDVMKTLQEENEALAETSRHAEDLINLLQEQLADSETVSVASQTDQLS